MKGIGIGIKSLRQALSVCFFMLYLGGVGRYYRNDNINVNYFSPGGTLLPHCVTL